MVSGLGLDQETVQDVNEMNEDEIKMIKKLTLYSCATSPLNK
jgi:hypothetical protein